MKTKIIPFDLEIAKKIQAGEIEGRIVNRQTETVRIFAFDVQNKNCIVGAVKHALSDGEYIASWDAEGRAFDNLNVKESFLDLVIELKAEAPKNELKEGNKPSLVCPKCLKSFDDCESQPAYHNRVDYKCPHCGYIDDSVMFETCYSWHPYNKKEKIELKPFDKVLVRNINTDVWIPATYEGKLAESFWCSDGYEYDQCIPYIGNEHLVGTTDNPE